MGSCFQSIRVRLLFEDHLGMTLSHPTPKGNFKFYTFHDVGCKCPYRSLPSPLFFFLYLWFGPEGI